MRRFSARHRVIAGGVATAVVAGGAAAAIASSGSNPQAMSLYASAQRAVGGYQAVSFTGGGTSYKVSRAAGGVLSFQYDVGATPRGYRRAVDHVLDVLRHGRVAEEVDTLSARGTPTVEIWLENPNNGIGQVRGQGCGLFFSQVAPFTTVGQPFEFAPSLRFSTPARSGSHWLLDSTYPLAGGTVSERDTISASSGLWIASSSSVHGGSYNHEQESATSFNYTGHHGLDTPPQIGRC